MYNFKPLYDEMFMEGKILERLPGNLEIHHTKFRGKLLVSHREFMFAEHEIYDSMKGTIDVASKSYAFPIPKTPSFVLGEVLVTELPHFSHYIGIRFVDGN